MVHVRALGRTLNSLALLPSLRPFSRSPFSSPKFTRPLDTRHVFLRAPQVSPGRRSPRI